MDIRVLQSGVVRERAGTWGVGRYLWAGWRPEPSPVNAFLVHHPEGLCLFDAGQSARAAQPGYFPRWHPFFRLARFELAEEDEVAAQLESSGLRPQNVRWVVLSHLHTDHVGGLEPFRDAEVVVSRVEWERARGIGGKLRGYLPQYWPSGLEPTLLELDGGEFGPFPASHDLAGDGALIVVATPGHTPGHVSLVVRRPGEPVLLGGDLAHNRHDLGRDAPGVARYRSEQGLAYVGAHDWDARSIVCASQTT